MGKKVFVVQFFKKITLCIRNKSETGKLVINYGVKIIKKNGTRQIFTVT